jgi:lysophospholipase L1-like esterase
MYAQEIADFEMDIAKRYGCYYVPDMQIDIRPNGRDPYWDDTNHPNKAGNELVARRIFAELKKALAASKKNRKATAGR